MPPGCCSSPRGASPEFRVWRPLAAAGLAWLLACFWLTPSFIATVAFNWPADSFGYHFGAQQRWLLLALAASAGAAIRFVAGRFGASFYFRFVILCAFTFGWFATAYYVYGVDTIPESRRYALEFELFLILAVAEAVRLALRSKDQTVRLCAYGSAGVMLLVGLPQLWGYLTQPRARWTPVPPAATIEYRLAKWLDEHHPQGRIFASGGLRFRLNSWFELAQVGGGFETGLRNRMPLDLAYHVRTGRSLRPGREPQDMLLELQALGVEYVVVHGPKSQEYYRDYAHPEWLAAVLPAVLREGDDAIYALPPRPLAHAMRPEDLPGDEAGSHPDRLERYVAAMSEACERAGSTPLTSPSTALSPEGAVRGRTGECRSGLAGMAGRPRHPRRARPSRLHHVARCRRPPPTHIDLRYRGTAEQRIMAALSAAAWIGALAALFLAKMKFVAIKAFGFNQDELKLLLVSVRQMRRTFEKARKVDPDIEAYATPVRRALRKTARHGRPAPRSRRRQAVTLREPDRRRR